MSHNKSWATVKDDIDKLTKIKGAVDLTTKQIDVNSAAMKDIEIKNLLSLRKHMVNIIGDIDHKIDVLHNQKMIDQANIADTLDKLGMTIYKKRKDTQTWRRKPIPQIKKCETADSSVLVAEVNVTKLMTLSAIIVTSVDSIDNRDGRLHYINGLDCFAVSVGGLVLMGNIGKIYSNDKAPTKIKPCKFGDKCMKRANCDYYHGPPDVRNFAANSWMYSYSVPGSRRFGSRDTLDLDIARMTHDDIQRFHDQTMHDILCSMLLKKYGKTLMNAELTQSS
jgi:hypothetical protein